LNLAWVPLVDPLTMGRYGAVNVRTLFLLSLCIPVTYLNNMLWTIHFAHGQLGWIFRAFAAGFILNVAGDIFLIPRYANEGAALAFLGAMTVQTLLYHRGVRELSAGSAWLSQLLCAACAGAAMLAAFHLASGPWARVVWGVLLYLPALLLTGRVRLADVRDLRRQFS
jgi:peptidoglycan biosynthesis protein MviN/MurJ (putative lipid II flippase)